MSVRAVEGSAGCGKTYRLMELLVDELQTAPLLEGQRVLALTYMHGARRRLADRLTSVAVLRRRFDCVTIDSFAWRLLGRWRALAQRLYGEIPEPFDARCDRAGALLERPEVCAWVVASFPIIVIDEAQDLRLERLRMARALATRARLLVAADEFQCLDSALRPNPLVAWMREACVPEVLTLVHRTNVPALLTGAACVRAGTPLPSGPRLVIRAAQGVPMAAANVANAIAWREGSDVAVITPSLQGAFASDVVERVSRQACGTQGNGPYPIRWEHSDHDEQARIMQTLDLPPIASTAETIARLERLSPAGFVNRLITWVRYQVRATGRAQFHSSDIEELIARELALRRRRSVHDHHPFHAMTVQQAKNREFAGVVVIWPYQVGGDAEHRRRLLYNALTRASRWCTIVAQGPQILANPPFK